MNIVFSPQAWEDYRYWRSASAPLLSRINRLIADACLSPSEGLGKPEALKYGIAGAWSRRITAEHRLVYRVVGDDLQLVAIGYHY